jgi:hypothetical protein
MIIPPDQISGDALDGLIEEFITPCNIRVDFKHCNIIWLTH